MDRKPACREAFRWLKELGYQHLALVFTRKDKRSSTYRMVREAYDEVYGSEHEPVIIEGVAIEEDAYQKAQELWNHPEIDCIFQMGMTWQQGFCRFMRKLGNSYPSLWGKKICWLDAFWVFLPLTTNPISWVRKVSSEFYLKRKKPLCSNQSLSSDKRLVVFQISLLI